VQCQNYQGRDRIGASDVALNCAKNAGFDWVDSGAGECAGVDGSGRGAEGVSLLQDSVKATKILGIKYAFHYVETLQLIGALRAFRKSCTILINGRRVCVHDGVWKECQVCQCVQPSCSPTHSLPGRPHPERLYQTNPQ
jgi:hypothetical protein